MGSQFLIASLLAIAPSFPSAAAATKDAKATKAAKANTAKEVDRKNAAICAACGRRIQAGRQHYVIDGKQFCSERCAKAAWPSCAVCGRKSKSGLCGGDGSFFCSEECFRNSLPRCSVCGRPSQSLVVSEVCGKAFCPSCAATCGSCFACGGFDQCERLPDGRSICPACLRRSLRTLDDALPIVRKVAAVMRDKLQMETSPEIRFKLVGLAELQDVSSEGGGGGTQELGKYIHRQVVETIETRRGTLFDSGKGEVVKVEKIEHPPERLVLLLDFLPPDKLAEVVAHELAHAWAKDAYPDLDKNLFLSEGFAQFVAAQVNSALGNERLNQLMRRDTDPVYGAGLRHFEAAFDKGGWEAVWRLLRQSKR